MRITDWPVEDRPREKLLQKGATSLSDAELLAIFLRVGIQGVSAVDLARQLLSHFKTLHGLFSASKDDLSQIKGMGLAKYAQLQSILEMAKRALAEEIQAKPAISSPADAKQYLVMRLGALRYESIVGIFLDTQNRVIEIDELARGTINQSHLYPREVVKRALSLEASGLILAHNHPSGELTASQADHDLTKSLHKTLSSLEIRLLDHIIVGANRTLSFAESGWL
ncbi:DNA repair protein RadC [Leeia sp. TBRC 13508]|uniref:DNA repair protein RadC n=1 Tax=Leeia speluncae TaxID=2884804 RepID=A0ABS8D1X8_9NEIS|nr:DNA repair protein RadC [Leeia speluncae]MCB6182192.1 DNA repair protein RadC [Leeia speluncae]